MKKNPVRVLHVLHNMDLGGIENALMNYYRCLDHNNLQFDFLLTSSEKCHFEDEIEKLGGRIYRIPPLTKSNPFTYLKAVNKFFKDHTEYLICHAHSASKSLLPLYIARRRGVKNLVAHSHTTSKLKGINGILREILKIPLKQVATNWFACSREAAIFLYGKNNIDNSKIKIVKNVIDTERFLYNEAKRTEIREKLGIDSDEILIGTVGRLTPVKNQKFIIDILKSLREEGVKAKAIFVGDGELRTELETYAATEGQKGNCIFIGGVSNVEDYYNAMDIFLLPSLQEGLGMSVIEAQTSGLKSIVSTGVPEECNISGLVTFKPLSQGVEAWKKEILNALPYLRENMKKHLIASGYDAKDEAKKLESFYLGLA